ncbi:uncharacterized protein LOC115448618 isoform X2 [Manduca sexta]|uniref:C2H2-type domain-containing protein n=2 Tax=Manduca sexta TaxID=7130 RepID=A0A921ZI16_MANSE|nr:uncharacterized protein LOC115448618 isoform X2 [Manduca sexta]KAG6458085.1 hypothetical protein O3G_MSEX010662 [Manduca sexta]
MDWASMSGGHSSSDSTGQCPQLLTAEYKDGQLQIVEVIPFDKDRVDNHILTDLNCDSSNDQPKYMQVLDSSKGLVQLDLLNLTLVRCQDGEESYQLVANAEASDGGDVNSDSTVTCVLQSSDNEGDTDNDNQDSYVVVDTENGQGPLVFLKSTLGKAKTQGSEEVITVQKKMPSPAELLEKAKALQRAKALMSEAQAPARRRGRKRKSDLPPPHELLASPNFKLYLYSCKLCNFKCNAVKEMSAHKASEHGSGAASRARGAGRSGGAPLQCARCPFRASVHSQLMKHVQEKHMKEAISVSCSGGANEDGDEDADSADVLVCGACGYESSAKHDFRRHIMLEHGASAC